jgi:SAM-dependent methyltransferase
MRSLARFDAFLDDLAKDVYPEPTWPAHHAITESVIEGFVQGGRIGPGSRVLDVGCGQGPALKRFRQFGIDAVGVTLGAEDAHICREDGFEVHEADQNFMDFEDGQFDMLWCRHVLEHSVAPLFTLREYRRLVKSSGFVYVEVPLPDTPANHQDNPNHYSVFTASAWRSLMARAGFAVDREMGFNLRLGSGENIYTDSYWGAVLQPV